MENSKREKIVSHFSVISQLKWLMNEFLVIFSPHQRIKKVLQDMSFSKNRAEVEYLWELFFFSFLMTFHFLSHISSDSIYHFTTEKSPLCCFQHFMCQRWNWAFSSYALINCLSPILKLNERAREAMKSFSRSDPWILKSTRFCLSLTHTLFLTMLQEADEGKKFFFSISALIELLAYWEIVETSTATFCASFEFWMPNFPSLQNLVVRS